VAGALSFRRASGTGGSTQQLQQAVELRHQRCTLRRIARLLLVPISTLARAMRRLGLNRLRYLDPKPPVQRYQWELPGDMIHVDIKQLARFNRVGHRITADPRKGSSPGVGYEKVHVAVDDATRLSYVEVLADEKGPTTVGFLSRAVAWFNGQGIECRRVLSDNGSAYKSHGWRKACQAMGLKAKKTRPYTPRTNGKAERFIKTLLEEWAYVMPYSNSAARNELLPAYLRIYNGRRCHMALGGLTPQQRLAQLQA
jgi:transposase InsO family protein